MNRFVLLIVSAWFMSLSRAQINPNSTQIVNMINEVRTNPGQFATKMQTNYSNFNFNTWIVSSVINNVTYNWTFMTLEGSVAFQEAVTVISSSSKAPNLTYASGLSVIAQFDVNAYRNNSNWLTNPYDVCNIDVGERVKELGTWKEIDQSIVGGIDEAEFMIVAMLVGDGDQYRRARNAILNQSYTQVGIGQGNLTTVPSIYNFIWAEDFNCSEKCPDIPATNGSYNCQLPPPFVYSSGTILKPFISFVLAFLLVVIVRI